VAIVARCRDVTALHLASKRDAELSSHLLLISDVLLAHIAVLLAMVAIILLGKVCIKVLLRLEWRIVICFILDECFILSWLNVCIRFILQNLILLIRRDIKMLALTVTSLTAKISAWVARTPLLEVLLQRGLLLSILLGRLGTKLALVMTLAVVVDATTIILDKVRFTFIVFLLLDGRVVVDLILLILLILPTALSAPAIVAVVGWDRI
jgi:type IV secretory pathway VirB2 component (pilin)